MVTVHSSTNEMLVSAIVNDVNPSSHLPYASQEWLVEVDKSTSLTASMSNGRRHWSSLTIKDHSQVASCMIHGPTFAVPWQDTLRSKQPGDSQHGGETDITLAEKHNWMQLCGLELFDVHSLPALHICNMMGFHCLSPIVWLLEEKDWKGALIRSKHSLFE